MREVAIILKLDDRCKAEIKFMNEGSKREIESLLRNAEVAITGYLPADIIRKTNKLRFIQAISAGHALALMLALAKKITLLDSALKKDKWCPRKDEFWLDDIRGKILGIIGYGNIGMQVYAIKNTLYQRMNTWIS